MSIDDRFSSLNRASAPDQWERIRRGAEGEPAPAQRGRAATVRRYVGIGIAAVLVAAAVVLPLKALLPLADKDKVSPADQPVGNVPDVAQISCENGRANVITPEVRAQADGVHIAATSDGGSEWLKISAPFYVYGWASEGKAPGDGSGIELPPGNYTVTCIPPADTQNFGDDYSIWLGFAGKPSKAAFGVDDPGAALTVADPDGLFTRYALDCREGMVDLNASLAPVTDGIPDLALALPRVLSGIRPGDEISQVGYPSTGGMGYGEVWQLSRGGATQGLFRVWVWTDWVVMTGDVCKDSGIHDGFADPERPSASSWEIPGYARCSPYNDPTCTPVWVSYAVYARATGEDILTGPDDNTPWCLGGETGPCMVHPRDMAYVVFMVADDAQRWFDEAGCGESIFELCQPPGTPAEPVSYSGIWVNGPTP